MTLAKQRCVKKCLCTQSVYGCWCVHSIVTIPQLSRFELCWRIGQKPHLETILLYNSELVMTYYIELIKFHEFLFHYTVPPYLYFPIECKGYRFISKKKNSLVVKIDFHHGQNQFPQW